MIPPSDRHMSLAYLWLFSAGVDPAGLDAGGVPLAESLAKALAASEYFGRREAAGHYVRISQDFDDEEEITQEYTAEQKTRLVRQ